MSEELNEVLEQDELSVLKARADLLGISYHPSIGVEKLRDKLNSVIEGETKESKKLRLRSAFVYRLKLPSWFVFVSPV